MYKDLSNTEVIVLGTIHSQHLTAKEYSLIVLTEPCGVSVAKQYAIRVEACFGMDGENG